MNNALLALGGVVFGSTLAVIIKASDLAVLKNHTKIVDDLAGLKHKQTSWDKFNPAAVSG